MSDSELIQEYALRHSETAFATLVSRHIDLVYSAAMRRVGNHHQAEEITQAVFVVLARKAGSFRAGTVLPGDRFCCCGRHIRKTDFRARQTALPPPDTLY